MNSLNTMKTLVNFSFRADELRQSDLRQRILHDFVKSDNYGTNSAIAFVDAFFQNSRVTFAMIADPVFVQNFDDFAQKNLTRRTRQRITAFCSARRLYETGFV